MPLIEGHAGMAALFTTPCGRGGIAGLADAWLPVQVIGAKCGPSGETSRIPGGGIRAAVLSTSISEEYESYVRQSGRTHPA